jgi:hypothetical protein
MISRANIVVVDASIAESVDAPRRKALQADKTGTFKASGCQVGKKGSTLTYGL